MLKCHSILTHNTGTAASALWTLYLQLDSQLPVAFFLLVFRMNFRILKWVGCSSWFFAFGAAERETLVYPNASDQMFARYESNNESWSCDISQ